MRLNKTYIHWNERGRYECFVWEDQTWWHFASVTNCQTADERCATRQGWTLGQYYAAIRGDMAIGGTKPSIVQILFNGACAPLNSPAQPRHDRA
jgi:hypothetical protein